MKTDKVRVSFYPLAGKLQISGSWKDRNSGRITFGRTAVLDKGVVGSSPEALALIDAFVKAARS